METNNTTREIAMKWWHAMTYEEKFFSLIKGKDLIIGYPHRDPFDLTGREIELLYNVYVSNK